MRCRMADSTATARRVWLYAFLLIAVLYAAHYSLGQAGKLEKSLHFSPVFAIAIVAAQLLFWLTYSLLWTRLIAGLSNARLTLWESFQHQNLLNLGKYLPGKIWGMVARGATLTARGLTSTEVVVATCTEQTLVLHSAGLVSALLFASLHPTVPTVALVIFLFLTLGFGSRLLMIAFRLYARMLKNTTALSDALEIKSISATKYLNFVFGYSVGWIVNGLLFASIYLTFYSAAPPSIEFLGILVLANTVGVALGFLALFAPGGIGVREAVTSAMLVTVMPLDDAIMLAVLFRLWLLLTDVFVGGLVVLTGRKELH